MRYWTRHTGEGRQRPGPSCWVSGLAATVMLLAQLTGPAATGVLAQHASVATGDPSVDACTLCHGSHNTGFSEANLKSGGVPEIVVDAPGIGPASQSCLRCHATAALRGVQAEFQESASASGTGRYLEYDLTDDHPLGRFDVARLNERRRVSPASYGEVIRIRPRPLRFETGSVIECTTCHDPHDRRGVLPAVEEERMLCTSCHEPGRYAFGGGHAELPCSGCHVMHGGHETELLAELTSGRVCASCHEESGSAALPDIESATALRRAQIFASIAPPSSQVHLDPPEGECVDCHAPHGSPRY